MFRIQKLMLSEFQDIYEPVIVENPFTQVTETGFGLKQFYIALTATKVLFGCDLFPETGSADVNFHNEDPAIESFHLVSLMPLPFVKLQFYRKAGREIMQLSIRDDKKKPLFFEFGGHIYKNHFWNTWRERIATIHSIQPLFSTATGDSPFSSTDGLHEEEECHALVHSPPKSSVSVCMAGIY